MRNIWLETTVPCCTVQVLRIKDIHHHTCVSVLSLGVIKRLISLNAPLHYNKAAIATWHDSISKNCKLSDICMARFVWSVNHIPQINMDDFAVSQPHIQLPLFSAENKVFFMEEKSAQTMVQCIVFYVCIFGVELTCFPFYVFSHGHNLYWLWIIIPWGNNECLISYPTSFGGPLNFIAWKNTSFIAPDNQ